MGRALWEQKTTEMAQKKLKGLFFFCGHLRKWPQKKHRPTELFTHRAFEPINVSGTVQRGSGGDLFSLRRCIMLLLLFLLFLTFSVLVANPKKLLYTVANPARGLLNREKRTKEKVWQHTPPPPHPPHCSFGENK